MTTFSERFGYQKPTFELADEDMPETLRNGLWEASSLTFFTDITYYLSKHPNLWTPEFHELADSLWFHFFRKPTDTRSTDARSVVAYIRSFFFEAKFYEAYNFLEFLARFKENSDGIDRRGDDFVAFCNEVFERERAAFRFARRTLVKINDENELRSVDDAMSRGVPSAIRHHIRRAAEPYSQFPTPDYRNSIKESISAVESAVAFATDAKRVGGVSIPLRKAVDSLVLHPALREGFEKLYAYTSDAEGIRHALMHESNLTQADALYMLVSCSAFSNYLVALKSKQS